MSNLTYGLLFTLAGLVALVSYKKKNILMVTRQRKMENFMGRPLGTIAFFALNILIPFAFAVFFFFFR